MMRLQTYGGLSLVATLVVIYHAFHSRGQFYPAMVHLSSSKISLVLLLNMGLVFMCILWQFTKRLFLGSLREAEVERLNEQAWREVMEILFAITIFRQDFSVTFLAMVTVLLLIKALHWLAQKRVEYIETTPSVPMLSHIRIVSFMGFLLFLDSLFLYNSVSYLIQTRQASVSLFFSFEYMILATTTVSTFVKYVFYVSDMLMEGQWEKKAVYTFYLELIRDLLHLSMYLCFFLVIFVNYGVPLHLIRELYETFRNFKVRVNDYIRYRKITSNMNDRFPDATPEELNASDATCIICREEMTTAKRLSCGHLFHVHCLRSWLERQHTCPTCRALVSPPENGTSTSGSRADAHQQGTGTASTPSQNPTGDDVANNTISQHQTRLQAAAAAASIYERSFVYPSANTLVWSPGYALLPQAQRPLADTINTDSSGEQSSTSQSQQHPIAIPGGPANLPFPHSGFVNFLAPGTDVNYGERFGSNLNTPDCQLEAQEKILQNQIKMLQSQLHLVQNSRAEKSMDTTVTASSEYKGKAVASSSSSCVSDCGRHGESEETEKRSIANNAPCKGHSISASISRVLSISLSFMAAEKLRDLSQPIDVGLLDATVAAFYGTGSKEERTAADHILRDLQNNPDMWLQVVHILSTSQNLNTKFFALQAVKWLRITLETLISSSCGITVAHSCQIGIRIVNRNGLVPNRESNRESKCLDVAFCFGLQVVLEGVIKYKWNALPAEQRDGMKNYISDVIVKLSSDEISFRRERLYVNKLNIILVQILKHEWPARWRSFIPDLVAAAKTSETICENCMAILKLLSEEVFDFSRGEMTQQKIKELKQSLNSEFQLIHELCLYVLSAASQRTELMRATLATLHAFLSWIPLGYIFESPLLETLLNFFPVPSYRNLTLQCLTEVAALNFGDFYNMQYVKMYNIFMVQLQAILPSSTNIPDAYAAGTSDEQVFIQNLALFFTSFYKASLFLVTCYPCIKFLKLKQPAQFKFHRLIFGSHIRVLESSQENISVLLLGLEYLINISYVDDTEVFKVCLDYWNSLVLELFEAHHNLDNPAAIANMMGLQMPFPGIVDGLGSQLVQRRQLYAGPMSKLRLLMVCRMAKPEEVLIVEDENGNIVRETMKDNDVLVQYKMLKKLNKQLSGEDWTWNNLNTLCWAIGSISGSMMEEQENRFLVMVIRDLLNLCEITKGKDNKAVIASNIMYVVGQYPRFLRAHWKFLKTVVNKLFEFMHETHPGVQDMACDTFLKIVQKCKRKFVIVQLGESEPFVSELLTSLPTTIADLEPHQIHSFYESKWVEIIAQARHSVDFLKDQDVIRTVLNILQTNTSVASSLGTYFLSQISLIFLDMLNVYRMYSELISTTIAEGGPFASKTSYVKLLRSVKRETLKLIETFLDKAEDQPQIGKQFVPPMMDPVLGDYARNLPDARESEVLSLFATIINKYKGAMIEDVPRIFEAVFQCTLEMITKNFEDYPEHRLKFFSLLRAIATHCFPALIRLSSQQLKLVMDSIIWAFRHTERNIAETGLNLLLEMLKNFQTSEFCNQFYRTYFVTIEQEIFAVLTDTFHKPGFKLHVLVLQHLFCLAESGSLTEPLWDVTTVTYTYPNNAMFVREYTIKLLGTSFPNMTATEVAQFVSGLFESRNDLSTFKDHIRDFLVQSKEFSAQDNKDLYAEEAAAQKERERQRMLTIPGLIAPNEIQDEMVDS
ncbi:hypothetical protein TEA_008712 [Camellia sinensis var. sinensis]|uniref:RING-type E3 ubiquitin transferase n=3 Tax=Camellia sinensis TaxID=4442 RepID=A0A4S4E237_CAMSN|nr:hypothetical protein TEA_008712 [Camellia sinensis var. sinensis]